jgi:signal transduction histidine kinase
MEGEGAMAAVAVVLALAVTATGALALTHRRHRRALALVAQASHELRGPLFAARLGLHGLAGDDPPARLAAIDLELARAGLALDDLAAAPRGRRAREQPELVDLGALLADAVGAWRGLAAARGVELAVVPPARGAAVRADRLRLAQALGNLVGNAIEHGGEEVEVRVRAAGGRLRVEVTDAGPGLPAPVADLVAAARGRRSLRGHGLAIAAAIAERHGGRLTSAPSPRGARLVLELPTESATHGAPLRRRRRRRRTPLRAAAP